MSRGHHSFLATEILDDPLLGASVLADALHEVEVSVAVDVLLADEHARVSSGKQIDSSRTIDVGDALDSTRADP